MGFLNNIIDSDKILMNLQKLVSAFNTAKSETRKRK